MSAKLFSDLISVQVEFSLVELSAAMNGFSIISLSSITSLFGGVGGKPVLESSSSESSTTTSHLSCWIIWYFGECVLFTGPKYSIATKEDSIRIPLDIIARYFWWSTVFTE